MQRVINPKQALRIETNTTMNETTNIYIIENVRITIEYVGYI